MRSTACSAVLAGLLPFSWATPALPPLSGRPPRRLAPVQITEAGWDDRARARDGDQHAGIVVVV